MAALRRCRLGMGWFVVPRQPGGDLRYTVPLIRPSIIQKTMTV